MFDDAGQPTPTRIPRRQEAREWMRDLLPLITVAVLLIGGGRVLSAVAATPLPAPVGRPERVIVATPPDVWPTPTSTLSEREPTPLLVTIWTPVPPPSPTPDVAATATANAIATARAPQVCPEDPNTLPKGSICQYPPASPTPVPTPLPMQGCVKNGPPAALCMVGNEVRVIPTATPYPTMGGHP